MLIYSVVATLLFQTKKVDSRKARFEKSSFEWVKV